MIDANHPEDHQADHAHRVDVMCFRDAWMALQTSVELLQSAELDIEDLSVTYERAVALADRCASILNQVRQQVTQLDPELLDADPDSTTGDRGD